MWREELPDWRLIVATLITAVIIVILVWQVLLPRLKQDDAVQTGPGRVRVTKRVRSRYDYSEVIYANCETREMEAEVRWRWDWMTVTIPYEEMTDEQFDRYCR